MAIVAQTALFISKEIICKSLICRRNERHAYKSWCRDESSSQSACGWARGRQHGTQDWQYWKTGLRLYYDRKFSESSVKFNTVLQNNPQDKAAQDFVNKSGAMVVSSERKNVNGLPTFRMVTKVRTNKGIIEIMSYFIQEGARVYEFHGLASETRFQGYSRIFENTMEQFKRITDRRKLNVKPDRIRVVRSPKAGTMEQVLRSLGAPEGKLNQWAIMNGKTLSDPIPSGMLLKIVKKGG